jgi:hypothetical protein
VASSERTSWGKAFDDLIMGNELARLGLSQATLDLREEYQPLDSVLEGRIRGELIDCVENPLLELRGIGHWGLPTRSGFP